MSELLAAVKIRMAEVSLSEWKKIGADRATWESLGYARAMRHVSHVEAEEIVRLMEWARQEGMSDAGTDASEDSVGMPPDDWRPE